MKKLLFSSALLAVCSIAAMDHGAKEGRFKFRLATSEDNLTPVMQMGQSIYEGLLDEQKKIPEDQREVRKEITSRKIGYIQAMVNAGNPNWPLVLIEKNNESIGFAAGEIIEHPKAIVLYMMPMKSRLLYAQAAKSLIAFVKATFPDNPSVITLLEPKGKRSFLSKLAIKSFGFKPCDGYTPNPQMVWPQQNWFIPYIKSLETE